MPVFFKIFHYSLEINVDGDAVADIIDEVFDEFDVDGADMMNMMAMLVESNKG